MLHIGAELLRCCATPEVASFGSTFAGVGRYLLRMPLRFIDDRWPLVIVEWPTSNLIDRDIEDFVAQANAYLARRERFAVVHDATDVVRPSAIMRSKLATHIHDHREEMVRYIAASGVVTPSPLVRGAVTAIHWISPAPFPQRTFATVEEATPWVLAQLDHPQNRAH